MAWSAIGVALATALAAALVAYWDRSQVYRVAAEDRRAAAAESRDAQIRDLRLTSYSTYSAASDEKALLLAAARTSAEGYLEDPSDGARAALALSDQQALARNLAVLREARAASRLVGASEVRYALSLERVSTQRVVEGLKYYRVPGSRFRGGLSGFVAGPGGKDLKDLIADARQITRCVSQQMQSEVRGENYVDWESRACNLSLARSRFTEWKPPSRG